jgi:hypothetical protein
VYETESEFGINGHLLFTNKINVKRRQNQTSDDKIKAARFLGQFL